MAKSLLRSGNLDDYQAVGGGGQAVFESALQIRETLRLRKQQAMVDCLAIPQLNDNGDRVDWYSPIEGQAIAWKAADEETRSRALRYLASTFESAAALSRKSLQSGKTALQLFGSLLEKATQFPAKIMFSWLTANRLSPSGDSLISTKIHAMMCWTACG